MATLNSQILSFSKSLDKLGNKGLGLLIEAMTLVSAFDKKGDPIRDWDGLATFAGICSQRQGEDAAFRRILRIVFGKQIALAKDPKHPSGFRFNFTDHCAGGKKGAPVVSNYGWDLVVSAHKAGKSFMDKGLHKEITEALNMDKPEAKKVWGDKEYAAEAARMVKKVYDEEMNPQLLIAAINAKLKADAALIQSSKAALDAARVQAKVIDIDDAPAVAA